MRQSMHKITLSLLLTLLSTTTIFCENSETKPKSDSQENSTDKQQLTDPFLAEKDSTLKNAMRLSVTCDSELYDYIYENASLEIKNFVEVIQKARTVRLDYKSYQEVTSKRLLLVGPPGVGKSTLAYAIAHTLKYEICFIKVPLLSNEYRNSAFSNLRRLVEEVIASKKSTIIILDEINILIDEKKQGPNDYTDMNAAAALWLLLDQCSLYSNIVVIATANDVSKLPIQLKDRFEGNIVEIYENTPFRRLQVLLFHLSKAKHSVDYNYLLTLAEKTTQFSPRQLEMLIKIAHQQQFLLTGSMDGVIEGQLEYAYQKILNSSVILQSKSSFDIRKWINENGPLIHTISTSVSLGVALFNICYFMLGNKNIRPAQPT